jgi:sporulation protein YlmC with PRC-barrel domain
MMLRNVSLIHGYAIAASDGQIGSVSDFLFDDASWSIRWLVVRTGSWLSGRKVLLPPGALGQIYSEGEEFTVQLTKSQIEKSPDVDTERPVSRQFEASIYDYYGWDPYWTGGLFMGGYPSIDDSSPEAHLDIRRKHQENDDPHLRSAKAVTGYHIHAADGEVGHVEDLLVDDTKWKIRFLLVDTNNWLPGKKVLIPPRSVKRIDWGDRRVNLDVRREQVQNSPTYDPSTVVDAAYEESFYEYYYSDNRPGVGL